MTLSTFYMFVLLAGAEKPKRMVGFHLYEFIFFKYESVLNVLKYSGLLKSTNPQWTAVCYCYLWGK